MFMALFFLTGTNIEISFSGEAGPNIFVNAKVVQQFGLKNFRAHFVVSTMSQTACTIPKNLVDSHPYQGRTQEFFSGGGTFKNYISHH